jgi:glycosyltransferase involved in cell wall biosynthesis
MRLAFGTIKRSFEDALHLDPELIGSARYAFNLAGWVSYFGPARVHVLFYDSLVIDSKRFVADFCKLCGTTAPELSDEALRERVNDSAQWRRPRFPLAARLTAETGWKLRFSKLSAFPQAMRESGLSNPFVTFGQPLPELTPAVAAYARNLLTGEIAALEKLLGIELEAWREGQQNRTYLEPITVSVARHSIKTFATNGSISHWSLVRKTPGKKALLALPVAGAGFSMERYGRSLAESLTELGDRDWSIESFRPGNREPIVPDSKSGHLRDVYRRYLYYPLAARRLGADVVHIVDHGYGHLLLTLKGVHTVVTCHDVIPWLAAIGEIPLAVSRRVQRSVVARLRCLKMANHVVADSNNTKRDLVRLMPELAGRTSVVYPGVASVFHPSRKDDVHEELRSKFAIEQNSKVLLHVGQASYKNAGKLVEVLTVLRTRLKPPPKLVVTGTLKAELHAEARRLGVADLIQEVDAPNDQSLTDLYRCCDVFVFPSWYEGFGWPPLEAMACGLPVVASRAGSLGEVLGDAALLCDPWDTGGFASAIEQLLHSKELVCRQIDAGIERAANYTWDKTARQMLEIYAHVAETPALN